MAQMAFWNKEIDKMQMTNAQIEHVAYKNNEMTVDLLAIPENEQVARMVVGAFLTVLNPTMEVFNDVKTAVSEAVTNSVIHGYPEGVDIAEKDKIVRICMKNEGSLVVIKVVDYGVGIQDIKQAMEPLYTSKPELERSGMGFDFMAAFMDRIEVHSKVNEGVEIIMEKELEQYSRGE